MADPCDARIAELEEQLAASEARAEEERAGRLSGRPAAGGGGGRWRRGAGPARAPTYFLSAPYFLNEGPKHAKGQKVARTILRK